jgi:hypothetical protein
MNIPQGSKIRIERSGMYEEVIIPYGSGSVLRFFIGLFLLFWLGGWFSGFKSALDSVLQGKAESFLIFWLCGWTLGGLFAVYFLFRVFRPSVNESFVLLPSGIKYDSGIPPFQMNYGLTNQKQAFNSMFPRRKKIEISAEQIRTLSLRDTDSGNRLTIDVGTKRIDIAAGASEIEREWLFKTLKERYA